MFQHTAARRRLLSNSGFWCDIIIVSTHSRTKAAAIKRLRLGKRLKCFNTQPHEGGCKEDIFTAEERVRFQHTAARRRLLRKLFCLCYQSSVSTHSRTKAAAMQVTAILLATACFNTQPHEGGCYRRRYIYPWFQCFNTQPHEGGCGINAPLFKIQQICFNTQPHEGGCETSWCKPLCVKLFQHTAARRRLPYLFTSYLRAVLFQHTAARRRLRRRSRLYTLDKKFQHTAARRRLLPT